MCFKVFFFFIVVRFSEVNEVLIYVKPILLPSFCFCIRISVHIRFVDTKKLFKTSGKQFETMDPPGSRADQIRKMFTWSTFHPMLVFDFNFLCFFYIL